MEITIYHYLFVGLIIFLTGLAGSILAKNVIKVLIAIEFMLTGVNINFVTFATYCDNGNFSGYVMTLFYTGIGAVEPTQERANGSQRILVVRTKQFWPVPARA